MHRAVAGEDWSGLNQAIAHADDGGPNQKRGDITWGRYGVNLLTIWRPSVFIGAYLRDHDPQAKLARATPRWGLRPNCRCLGKGEGTRGIRKPRLLPRVARALAKGFWGIGTSRIITINRTETLGTHFIFVVPCRTLSATRTTSRSAKDDGWTRHTDAVEILLQGGELAELHRQIPHSKG